MNQNYVKLQTAKFNQMKFSFLQILLMLICLVYLSLSGKAQDFEAKVKILSVSPAKIQVEGKVLRKDLPSFNWSFVQSYADVERLGSRYSALNLADEKNQFIPSQELIPGEFQSNKIATHFKYDVNIDVLPEITAMAHVSWLSENKGLLMLNDIFPEWQVKENQQIRGKIKFELPNGWQLSGNENKVADNEFDVADISKAVFLIGKNWRERSVWLGRNQMILSIFGEWQFTDDEALQISSAILQEHKNTFGELAVSKSQIFILPFPEGTNPDRWRAETRGTTVTVMSGSSPYKSVAKQRLSEQLRHEIFHLWSPNNLALSGSYDWFYEGFTIYQALRAGVQLNQLRFDDYLKTLARAFDVAQTASNGQKLSLIQASNRRWEGSTQLIYNKGIIVAFLCDLAILQESNGKRSLTDVYRQIYRKHQFPNQMQDGNTAILKILKEFKELRPIVENYVESNKQIDWTEYLTEFGIESEIKDNETELKVLTKPNGKQKDLLNKLGYNQWRKMFVSEKF